MPSLTELRSLLHSFPTQLPASVRQKALHALLQHSGMPLVGTLEALRTEAQEAGQRLQQQLTVKKALCEREAHALDEALSTQQDERIVLIQTYTQQREQLYQKLAAFDEVLLCLGEETVPEIEEDTDRPLEATTLTPSRRARVLGLK